MLPSRIKYLLIKRSKELCSPDELDELFQWLDSHEEEAQRTENYLNSESQLAKSIENELLKNIHREILENEVPEIRRRSINRTVLWRAMAAASVLILLTLFGSLYTRQKSHKSFSEEIVNTSNESKKIILSDQSVVWLKKNSSIVFNKQLKDNPLRELQLEGEAFFEISHNPEKPFIVHTGVINIKVLGTSFNVRSYGVDDSVETSLISGKVSITKNGEIKNSLILAPNEQAIYSKKTKSIIVKQLLNPSPPAPTIVNTDPKIRMIFDEQPMKDVLTSIETRFNIKINVENRETLTCKFSADFEKENLTDIINLLKEVHGINCVLYKNELYINGQICLF
jgi:transmembrane sensor